MKKKIALGIIVIVSVGLLSFVVISKNGKAGYTGSPGENSCNQCHNSFALNSGNGSIYITTNIPNDLYVPDSVYEISVTVAKPGVNLFGFGLEVLDSDQSNSGLLIVTNSLRTHLLNAANGRKNMTHKLNGGAFADSAVFTFNWRAPSTNVGPVTFYYTGVCADSSNSNSGDYVYKGLHTINSTSTVGIDEANHIFSSLSIQPFPNGRLIDVLFHLKVKMDVNISLYALDGKLIQTQNYLQEDAGEKAFVIYMNDMNQGVYIIKVMVGNQMITKKFLWIQ